jgi:hypothetical protein
MSRVFAGDSDMSAWIRVLLLKMGRVPATMNRVGVRWSEPLVIMSRVFARWIEALVRMGICFSG